jgi:hypothetical protein
MLSKLQDHGAAGRIRYTEEIQDDDDKNMAVIGTYEIAAATSVMY